MNKEGFSIKKRIKSFGYAFNGIRLLFCYEHNAWIHLLAVLVVTGAGVFFQLSKEEWIAVVTVIGMVLSAEAINSAIEVLCDLVSPGYNEAIKRAKDLAAGAVLLTAIAAAIVGLIIFVPKMLTLLNIQL